MTIQDDLNDILTKEPGEDVASAIVNAMTKLQAYKYPNANIQTDLLTISVDHYGKNVKGSISGAISKMSNANLYVDGIKTLTETEYKSIPHLDNLYGIQDSTKIRVLELTRDGQATDVVSTFDSLRDAERFITMHTDDKYHVEIGKDFPGTELLDYLFSSNPSLYSIAIPNSFASIPEGFFYNSGLTEIWLPESLGIIGDVAFLGTNITMFDVPRGITLIGENAFKNCDDLATIVLHCEEDTISGAPWGAPNATVMWTGGI